MCSLWRLPPPSVPPLSRRASSGCKRTVTCAWWGRAGSELQLEKGAGVQSSDLPQAQAVLQGLLQESAAYRGYLARLDARLFVEQLKAES